MQLKYVGPQPIISHTGIEFDNNEDDKLVYLNIVIQFIKALQSQDFKNKTYTYNTNASRISNDILLEELTAICPNIETIATTSTQTSKEEILASLKAVEQSTTLTSEDKKIYKKNIEIMQDYQLQYTVNGSVYDCAIKLLASMLEDEKISYIVAPMFQKFAYVLHSVQNVLQKKQSSIATKLDIYQEDGKLRVKLKVQNI